MVDLDDLEIVMKFSWHVRIDPKNGLPYAYAFTYQEGSDGKLKKRRWFMARLVMGIPVGDPREVDHKDVTSTLDNRKANLRIATRSQNNANRRLFKNNTSGFRGVYRDGEKWEAILWKDRTAIHLGTFNTPEEASLVYCSEKMLRFGEFARVS